MPVTGAYTDGPEWGTQPYTNMFASDEGSVDPKYPANTTIDAILKAHGGTVLGAYGYGISPTSTRAAEGDAQAATHLGMKVGVLNTSVPFGSVDFTSDALDCQAGSRECARAIARQQLQLRPGGSTEASRSEAQGGTLRHRVRAGCDPLAGLERPAGRLFRFSVPSLGSSERGNRADAGGHGEVRALHQERFPQLRPVRGVGGSRPHDQGTGTGGQEPDPGRRHQGSPGSEVLYGERAAPRAHRLLHDLWARPGHVNARG